MGVGYGVVIAVMAAAPHRAVFLDRDGVLIRPIIRDGRPFAATAPEEVEILSGVPQGCSLLSGLGYLLILMTNQPDVARGKITRRFVDETNTDLQRALGLDDVAVCDHDDSDGCDCRKPKPGLIIRATQRHDLDLAQCIVVGDRWRDIAAGRNAGCKTVFIDYGYDEPLEHVPDHIAPSLLGATAWIREQSGK